MFSWLIKGRDGIQSPGFLTMACREDLHNERDACCKKLALSCLERPSYLPQPFQAKQTCWAKTRPNSLLRTRRSNLTIMSLLFPSELQKPLLWLWQTSLMISTLPHRAWMRPQNALQTSTLGSHHEWLQVSRRVEQNLPPSHVSLNREANCFWTEMFRGSSGRE